MVLDIVFGIIALGIAIFVAVRVIGSLAIGMILIALVLLASYLLMGGFPDLKAIPIVGKYLPELPRTTGEAIATIKTTFYNIEILGFSKDSDNNLLVTVANTGRMKVSNFAVIVDNDYVKILNKPRDPLDSRSITVIQTGWKQEFKKIVVQTDQTSASFSLEV